MDSDKIKNNKPFIFSIRTKLILIISTIVALTSATMIILAVITFKGDNLVRIQESNLSQAKMVAKMIRSEFNFVFRELRKINSLINIKTHAAVKGALKNIFFQEESNILYFATAEIKNKKIIYKNQMYNDRALAILEIDKNRLNNTNHEYADLISKSLSGEPSVLNASIYLNKPVLSIIIPMGGSGAERDKILITYIDITNLLNSFRLKDEITGIFIVNNDGDILVHSNPKIILSGGNYSRLPIVKMMKTSPMDNGHYRYKNEEGLFFMGSFFKIGFSGIGVVAAAEEEKVYRAVYQLQNIYIYITIIILTIAIMAVYVFCKNITEPIREIVGAVEEIENGDFNVKIKPKTNDELGELTRSIIQMGRGLEERERIEKQNEELVRQNFEVAIRNEQLRELDRMKTNFFANVSHEIRTPLTMILSPVESAIQGDFEHGTDEEFLRGIQRNAIRLLRLVNNILDFARIEEGQVRLNIEERDIVKVVENYTDVISQTAESRGISLSFTASSESIMLFMDIEKIDRILMNLISNALKFTDSGGRVGIHIREDDKNCYIDISDTGVGIPHDKIDAIFDRFTQVDPESTRKYEGTGIGLALAKEFALMHNGCITVESRHIDDHPDNHGSIFTLTIPGGKEHFENMANVEFSEDSEVRSAVSDRRFAGMREMAELGEYNKTENDAEISEDADDNRYSVLVVEDNRDMRKFLVTLLKKFYNVHEAEDGLHGLKILESIKPDLIVTDVMMPRLNGYDMTKTIKQNENLKLIPVVMLTAKADMANKIEGLEFGADDYVTKPFNSKELLARVRNLLKTYEYEKIITERNAVIENDLQIARLLQQRLLPEGMPQIPGFNSHVSYIPMDKVGGDFYDFIIRDDTAEIFIADVSGHGISGAFLATVTKMAFRAVKERDNTAGLLTKINRVIYESTVNNRFVTAFYCLIDLKTKMMTFSNAGHVPPLVYRKDTGKFITLKTIGMPLGIFDEFEIEQGTFQLESGDRIFFYTDGATEVKQKGTRKIYGVKQLEEFIAANRALSPADFTESLLKHLHEYSGSGEFSDDFCLLVLDLLANLNNT